MLLAHRQPAPPAPVLEALPAQLTLALSELPPADAAALVRAQSTLPDPVVAQIVERGQGHPFFLEELAKAYAEGDLPAVPDTVQDLVQARIDRLPEPQKLALKLASVLGRRFAVAALAGSYPPDVDSAAVPAHLAALTHLDLLRPDDTPTPTYAFTQAITQEVACGTLLSAQRRAPTSGPPPGSNKPNPTTTLCWSIIIPAATTWISNSSICKRPAPLPAPPMPIPRHRILPATPPAPRPLFPIPVWLDLAEISLLIEDRSAAEVYCIEALSAAETACARTALARAQLTMGQVVRNRGALAEAGESMERARAGFPPSTTAPISARR